MLESKSSALPLGYIPIFIARLFPSCQCLFHSHGATFPTNVCVFFPHRQPHLSGGHRSFPVVRKEITMKITSVIGSTTNPIRGKRVIGKQTLREGPVGKETTGERIQTLSGSLSGKRSGSSPVYAYSITHLSAIVKRVLKTF